MIPKPPECVGCPLYGQGQGFVPDELIDDAEVFAMFQNPGEDEVAGRRILDDDTYEPYPPAPVIGKTGRLLSKSFLPLAGVQRGRVSLGNVLRCRWDAHCKDKKGEPTQCNHLPTGKKLEQAVAHCRVHDRIPESTRLFVASGAHAWRKMGGPGTVKDWRGFTSPDKYEGRPVLCTLHVADLFREPIMFLPSQLDWQKVPRILRGEIPRPLPPYKVVTFEDTGWVDAWFDAAEQAPYVILDTEYHQHTKYLFLIGMRAGGVNWSCLFDWRHSHEQWFRAHYLGRLWKLVQKVPFVFQNALADLPVLEKNISLKPSRFMQVEDTLLAHAVLWTEYPHRLEFIASLGQGNYPKLKHLSELDLYLYNHGDLLTTEEAWLGLSDQFKSDPQSYHIYRTRVVPLILILIKATQHGIRTDKEKAKVVLTSLKEKQKDANDLARAWVGYPINVGSTHQLKRELVKDGIRLKNLQYETVAESLMKHPDSPILRARFLYSRAEGFRKYVAPMTKKDRVHPEFLPTQSTGRISVTKPPLVNFPDDAKAEKRGLPPISSIIVPDPGTFWLCWDWTAMHARFMAAACKDQEDLEAFEKDYDLHTITACRSLKIPLPPNLKSADHPDNAKWREEVGWKPKDRRRHLFKTVRYSLLNGLNEKAVREAKEVVEQGLDLDELERIGRAFLAAKTHMTRWKIRYAEQAIKDGCARSLYGRKRLLITKGQADKAREEKMKAAISGFLQMTEVDIMEETLIEACRRYPEATLVFPSHDGIKLSFPNTYEPDNLYRDLRPWVERSHDFWGTVISMPAEFSVVCPDGTTKKLVST